MHKDKPIHDVQTENSNTFWRIWRVRLPLGLLAANLLFCLWLIDQDSSVNGLAFIRLVSSWKFWKLFGTIAAVIGLAISTIAAITKRSPYKGALVGLEIFLDTLIGAFTGATTGSLINSAGRDENTISGLMFIVPTR